MSFTTDGIAGNTKFYKNGNLATTTLYLGGQAYQRLKNDRS
jgi:hypothetical protein